MDALDSARQNFSEGSDMITDGLEDLDAAADSNDEAAVRSALDKLREGLNLLSAAASEAGRGMDYLDGVFAPSAASERALSDLRSAANALDSETGALSGALNSLRDSLKFETKNEQEREEADAALANLEKGNSGMIAAFGEAAAATSGIVQNGNLNEENLQKLGDALYSIGNDTIVIAENLETLEKYVSFDSKQAINSIRTMLTTTAAAVDTLGEAGDAAARLATDAAGRLANMDPALRRFSEAFDLAADALTATEQGVRIIEDTFSDSTALRGGLRGVLNGLEDLERVSAPLGDAAALMKQAMTSGQDAAGQLKTATETLSQASDIFTEVSGDSKGILDQAEDLLKHLSEADPIQFSRIPEEIDNSIDAIYASLNSLGDALSQLNGQGLSASGALTGNLREINAQFGTVSDALLDLLYDLENPEVEDRIEDTSAEDVEGVTTGKLRGSVNHAAVTGDINVGGVTGSMGIEYEFDPENDLMAGSVPVYRREYAMKAILETCENDGTVTARRDFAGSVCGNVELGLITRSVALGSVESESGDYVGGVAGFSAGTVRDSFAKCTLAGRRYVGGIVGAQAADTTGSSGGLTVNCVSFVRVDRADQYSGAVAGSPDGSFVDNRFLSDELAGLDGVSAAGSAEPVTYEQLMQIEGLPDHFRSLTLRFLDGDETVQEQTFDYGASFGQEVFPALPVKDGCFAKWDRTELKNLRFDTDVHAVYAPFLTAVAPEITRNDGRPAFLLEGAFSDTDRFSAVQAEDGGDEVTLHTPFLRRTQIERWYLDFPDGTEGAHTLRYLSPSGDASGLSLWVQNDDVWQKLSTEDFGSYLRFTLPAGTSELAVASETSLIWIWAVVGLGVLAVAFLLIRVMLSFVRRKARKTKPLPPPETADGTEAAPGDETAAPAPRKKRRRWILPVVICGAAAAAVAVILLVSGVLRGAAAGRLLAKYAAEDTLSMYLSVDATLDDRNYYLGTNLYRTTVEGKRVTAAERSGLIMWYSDGCVYLENGKFFRAGGVFSEHSSLLENAVTLFRQTDVTVFENHGEKIYTITVGGDAAESLLQNLLPLADQYLSDLGDITMELVERSGQLYALRISSAGTISSQEDSLTDAPFRLSASLLLREDRPIPELPTLVRARLAAGGEAPEPDEAMLRLLGGWLRLKAKNPLYAEVSLSADCGPLILSDQLSWTRKYENGSTVNCIRKNGLTLYEADGTVTDEAGETVKNAGNLNASQALAELAYRAAMLGEPGVTEKNDTTVFLLTLDDDDMRELFSTLLPDGGAMDVSLSGGSASVTLRDGQIERILLRCGGEVRLLAVSAPASLTADLQFPLE